jgi:hypothetical protein
VSRGHKLQARADQANANSGRLGKELSLRHILYVRRFFVELICGGDLVRQRTREANPK